MATNPTTPTNTSNPTGSTTLPDFNSYYQAALGMIQPTINAETAPLTSYQSMLPSIYQQKQTALQDAITGQQNIGTAQENQNTADEQATATQLKQQNKEQIGAAKAQADASGMGGATSGVESSQEANINLNLANTLAGLTARTNAANGIVAANTENNVKQYQDMIAELPNQQAKDALSVASQIASIQGQGINEAIGMAGNMLTSAIQQSYDNAMLALKQGDQEIALQTLAETASYHQALIGIQQTDQKIKESQLNLQWNEQQFNENKPESVGQGVYINPKSGQEVGVTQNNLQKTLESIPVIGNLFKPATYTSLESFLK